MDGLAEARGARRPQGRGVRSPPARRRRAGLGRCRPEVLAEQARIARNEALAFVFPVWWWSFPATTKGWIDRVWSNGWAYGGRFLPQRKALLIGTASGDQEGYRKRPAPHRNDVVLRHSRIRAAPPVRRDGWGREPARTSGDRATPRGRVFRPVDAMRAGCRDGLGPAAGKASAGGEPCPFVTPGQPSMSSPRASRPL